jgi:DNA-binding GntR family transcriptional regulator
MHRPLPASPKMPELPADYAPVPNEAPRQGKIVRSTTVDLVLEAIRGKILRGELGSGEALRQEALAEELGVSRVPVREAISVDEVRETFEMRLRLEPWIFSRAIPATTEAARDAALALVDQMDRATESTWATLNWRFHETLYLPSGLNLAIETLKRLNDRNERFFRFQVVNVPIRENTHREHVELVDASRAGNTRLGARLLREHLHTAMEQIVSVAESLVSRQSRREAD